MEHSICIPGVPPVEVGAFRRIIDAEAFQALRGRKQLGVNHIVFPGAVHTRFEHSIGVLSLVQRICTINKIADDDARHLQAFALLHDIGHGPFSHQIETVIPGDHHQHGASIIKSISSLLQSSCISPERILAMLDGTDKLGQWVSDRNLGADKLDYLARDAMHIGFHGTPDIERIQYYTILTDEGLAIEEKYVEDAKQLQRFYSYLHQHGYLNKTTLSAQRMLQRSCQERIKTKEEQDVCWNLEDHQLFDMLADGTSPLATSLANALHARKLHKTFLVIKPTGYAYVEREADKPVTVLEWQRSEMKTFCDRAMDIRLLSQIEDSISEKCSLPPGSILFAAMPYFRKLLPKDLRVYSPGGHASYWLFDKDVDHRRALESDYLRTFAIRLVCPQEHRSLLLNKSEDIVAILHKYSGSTEQ